MTRDTADTILYGRTATRGNKIDPDTQQSAVPESSIKLEQLPSLYDVYDFEGYDPTQDWPPEYTEDVFQRDLGILSSLSGFDRRAIGQSLTSFRYQTKSGSLDIYFPDLALEQTRVSDRETVLINGQGYSWTGALEAVQQQLGLKLH